MSPADKKKLTFCEKQANIPFRINHYSDGTLKYVVGGRREEPMYYKSIRTAYNRVKCLTAKHILKDQTDVLYDIKVLEEHSENDFTVEATTYDGTTVRIYRITDRTFKLIE